MYLDGNRKPSERLSGLFSGLFWVIVLLLLVFAAYGCSEYRFVRTQELVVLADGIAYHLERVQPLPELSDEEKAKVKRVGLKILRNARALTGVKNGPEDTEAEGKGASEQESGGPDAANRGNP